MYHLLLHGVCVCVYLGGGGGAEVEKDYSLVARLQN